MINIETLKLEIIKAIEPLNPNKVILFGSHAYGKPNEDSDIDLYIVTNDDNIPKNYDETTKLYLKFAKKLKHILRKYPTDLIVHTKAMYKKALKENHRFIVDEIQKGKVIYG